MFRKIGSRLVTATRLSGARVEKNAFNSATRAIVDTLRNVHNGLTKNGYNPLAKAIARDTRNYVQLMEKFKMSETKKIAAMLPTFGQKGNLQQLMKREVVVRDRPKVMSLTQRMHLQNSIFTSGSVGGGAAGGSAGSVAGHWVYPKRVGELARKWAGRVKSDVRQAQMNVKKLPFASRGKVN